MWFNRHDQAASKTYVLSNIIIETYNNGSFTTKFVGIFFFFFNPVKFVYISLREGVVQIFTNLVSFGDELKRKGKVQFFFPFGPESPKPWVPFSPIRYLC